MLKSPKTLCLPSPSKNSKYHFLRYRMAIKLHTSKSILINKYYFNISSQMQLSFQLFHVHNVQSAARSQVGMIFMVASPIQCDHLNHPNFTRPQKQHLALPFLNQCPSILTDINSIFSWLPIVKCKLWASQIKLSTIIWSNTNHMLMLTKASTTISAGREMSCKCITFTPTTLVCNTPG